MNGIGRGILSALMGCLVFVTVFTAHAEAPSESLWYEEAGENTRVNLWFFWSETCPHCRKAKPFLRDLQRDLPWLHVRSGNITEPSAVEMYALMARLLNVNAGSVPAFFFCGDVLVGFGSNETTGVEIRRKLVACHNERIGRHDTKPLPNTEKQDINVAVPILGNVSADAFSLPLFTVMIAGLDAFNPCAFFVLLFLLSLLVHAPSRFRMALIGCFFVVTSGVVYFLSMAAWLNVFLLAGEMRWMTAVAAIVAIVLALLNIKDFLGIKRGFSLSMSTTAQADLFERIRNLLRAASLPTMLGGTVALAMAANLYELVCTSGLPMVFSRVLTLNALSTGTYYLYLALYNAIYVVPLAAIVAVFVVTLGSRKLQEHEGRILKLMSGTMMLGLGIALLIAPGALADLRIAAGIIGVAVVVAVSGWFFIRRTKSP